MQTLNPFIPVNNVTTMCLNSKNKQDHIHENTKLSGTKKIHLERKARYFYYLINKFEFHKGI